MRSPTDETGKLLVHLEVMRASAYKSFSDRRDYEWKFCISLWTVLIVYVSALVIGPIETGKPMGVTGWPLVLGTLIGGLLVIAVHWRWTRGLSRANAINQEMADQITDQMRSLLEFPWNESIRKLLPDVIATRGKDRHVLHWSHDSELAITILLAALAVAAAIVRAMG